MRQFLFVVNNGRIAFWQFHRGCLSRRSLNGNVWNVYNSAFWDEWCGANLPEDFEDAILLSDRPDEPIELPPWFNRPDNEASKWTLETFSKIVNDGEFAGKGVGIYLGTKKYDFSSGSPEKTFWFYHRKGNLCSQFAAAKEKQIKRAMAEDLEKRRVAEELKKREAELVRKRVEEERRAEEAKRAAEENRKQEAELARINADEARRVRAIFENVALFENASFENESEMRFFNEWKRLRDDYCKEFSDLTFMQAACIRVNGILLPRNCLYDVAMRFLFECVSANFPGRGEAEWVKDRGAVLGIFLLHYIRSPYSFDCNGEEAEGLKQIYQLAQRQSIQDQLFAHIHKYLEIF